MTPGWGLQGCSKFLKTQACTVAPPFERGRGESKGLFVVQVEGNPWDREKGKKWERGKMLRGPERLAVAKTT